MFVQCPRCKKNVYVSDNTQNAIVCPECFTIIREAATPPPAPTRVRPIHNPTPSVPPTAPRFDTPATESPTPEQTIMPEMPIMPEAYETPITPEASTPPEYTKAPDTSFGNEIPAAAPPPYSTPVQEQYQLPEQNAYYYQLEPEKKNNAALWWIILGVLAIALAVGIILIVTKKNSNEVDIDNYLNDTDSTYTENISDIEEPYVEEYADSAQAAPAVQEAVQDVYYLPYMSTASYAQTFYDELKTGNFVNTWPNIRRSDFTNILPNATVSNSQQITTEDSNGYRYQFYFLGDDDRLTGVAVSHATDTPSIPCYTLDTMIEQDTYFTCVGDNQYELPNGCLVSPGYTATRFYIYYYMPNAPVKDPAPRRN